MTIRFDRSGRPETRQAEQSMIDLGQHLLEDATSSINNRRHYSSVQQDTRVQADYARDLMALDIIGPVSRYEMFGD